jgi:ATP-dependent Clp protease ATP-binding subunit ClpA
LQLKEEKKRKEQEEKERKKAERERKKLEREQEKVRKQEDREAKKAEKQRKMEEKEKLKDTGGKRGRGATTSKNHGNQYKAHCSSSSSTSVKQYPKRRALEADCQPQSRKVSGDTCAVCCGTYADDVDDVTGEVTADWIQCTDDDCAAWSHVECLEEDAGGVICALCSNVFS